MNTVFAWIGTFISVFVISLYRALLIQCLWNWFATKAFGLHSIGYINTLGLMMIFSTIKPTSKPLSNDYAIKTILLALDFIVPHERLAEFKKSIEELNKGLLGELGMMVIGEFCGITFTFFIAAYLSTLA